MATPTVPAPPHRFLHWELLPAERELRVRGKSVALGARAFDVLLTLCEAVGQVVTKDELLARAWRGLVVEENNISVQIAALRRLIGNGEITTVPGIGYRLSAAPLAAEPAPPPPASPSTARPLFGRSEDLEIVVGHLSRWPLVSVIGSGGVGKTALARAVFERCSGWPSAHWIDLAPLRAAEHVVPAVAKALGIAIDDAAPAALAQALAQESRTLVVLDNCEQLAAAVAELVASALDIAPGVCWLATSQLPLQLAQECVYRLEPLDVPAADAGFEQAVASASIALLYYRAATVDRHFEITRANIALAIDLCRRLDGLPLAIEMAAARVPTLGLDGVHRQLSQRLRLPSAQPGAPSRQQTLRATLDWSFQLLSAVEQTVFRRLEPLAGSFTLAMAQRLTADGQDGDAAIDDWLAAESLGGLVRKSLLQRDGAGRYFLLESARDYAREKLAAAGETIAWQRRFAGVVADEFTSAAADLDSQNDDWWRRRYVLERYHVRAALRWACDAREPELLARLVAAQAQLDSFVRGLSDAVQCNVPLDVLMQAPPRLRAAACLELSWAHFLDGSRRLGAELAERARDDFEALGDSVGLYRALAQLSRLYEARPGLQDAAQRAWERFRAMNDSRVPWRTRLFCAISGGPQYGSGRSVQRLQQLQDLAESAGFETLAAVCIVQITDELLVQGRFAEAVAAARRYVDEQALSPRIKGTILMNQVLALVQLGRRDELREPVQAALRALPNDAYLVVSHLALAAARAGNLVDAALATGHAQQVRQERDEHPDAAEAAAVAETQALLAQGLAPGPLRELLRDGAAMPAAGLLARLLH